jgi:hypothetical protein
LMVRSTFPPKCSIVKTVSRVGFPTVKPEWHSVKRNIFYISLL